MSDAPQGEGWWQASDGRWYPPQTTPPEAAAPSAATPTSPPFAEPGAAAGGPGTPLGPPPAAAPSSGSGGGGKALVGVIALLVGALLGAGITWAVTGGGGDDADDWSAFCDRASELEAEAGGEELSDEEGQAAFAELVTLAPDDYQELLAPLEAMADGGSTEDIDAFGDAFGAIFYLAAILEVECGLDMGDDALLGGDDMGLDSEGSFELDGGDLGLDEGTDDTSDAGIDEEFFDDEDEPLEPMDIDAIQAWLEENHGDAAWLPLLSTWSVDNDQFVSVSPFDEPLSAEDALAACDAIAEYVWQHAPDGTVEVTTPEFEVQARGEAGGACESVG